MLAPPPVDRIFAIYGINLKTETFYFFKKSQKKGAKKVTELELDPEVCILLVRRITNYNSYLSLFAIQGQKPNFKCEGGVAYETKDTRQNTLRGKPRGGTLPFS